LWYTEYRKAAKTEDMEILFKNNYTRTKELAKEFYGYLLFGSPLSIVLNILMVVALVEGIIVTALNNLEGITWTVIIFFLIVYRVYTYFYAVKMMIKRDLEVNGKEIEIEITVTNEHIMSVSTRKDENMLEYGNITKVFQTKNLILVKTKAKLVHIFRKDSFTVGNKDDFIVFLKDKGITVKGK